MGTKQYLAIQNVEIVPGKELIPYWNKKMQVIITDKYKYIDELPENGGYDWKQKVGAAVSCYITESKGYKWISPLKKEMKSEFHLEEVNTSKAEVIGVKRMDDNKKYLINSVEIVPGNLIKEKWKDDMQKIETDKGVFIDNLPENGGYDWRKEKGKFVFAKENTSQNCRYTWLKLENVNKAEVKDSSFTKGQTIELVEELPPNYNINDNPELVEAYKAIKQNVPVIFLTGGAGTGKSTFIKFLKNNLKADINKNYVVLAPTGVAAINIGGQTIHSFFGWKEDVFEDKDITDKLNPNPILNHLDIIIIDEISMVHSWMVDHIDYALRLWFDKNKPFGGKQLLLIGDCFQLPPVTNSDDEEKQKYYTRWESPFFFAAKSLKKLSKNDIKAFQLKKIYRQENDQQFIGILNRIRERKNGFERDIENLNDKCFIETRLRTKNVPPESLLLCTTNDKADDYNNTKLLSLLGKGKKSITYKAFIQGDFHYDSKRFLTKDSLDLCVGAKIMVTKNINSEQLVNGDMGIVLGFGGTGNSQSDYVDIEVKGKQYRIKRETWEIQKYKWNDITESISQIVVGSFNQIPLTLGWAVTIHKSQGLTLDYVAIDAPNAWDSGQIYVALSRSKTLNGILLCQKIPVSAIKVDAYVVKKYAELFPESNEENSHDENENKNIETDNSIYTVNTTEEKPIVEIGGIKFELYLKNGEKIGRYAEKCISKLLLNKLIPEPEIKRLLTDKEYCYSIFGIRFTYPNTKYTEKFCLLSSIRDESNRRRYWETEYNGFYICSQWYDECLIKIVRWLIDLSEGKLNSQSISYEQSVDDPYLKDGEKYAKERKEKTEKHFKELLNSREENKREKEIQKAEVTKKRIVQNACNRMATRGGSVVGSGSSANKKQEIQDKPNDTILAEVIVKREDSKNGYYYFHSVSDEKELIARKDGKRKQDGVPDLYTKIKLIIYEYEQDGDIIKKWSWKRV